jgi:excisionase family DNA binding protein
MLFNETIDVGNKGLYYFVLQKGYKIDQLLFQPDEIIVDLFIHKDGRLIYSFYNSTQKRNIIIKGKITNDIEKIAERLKSNLTDVAFREYFIKLAIEDFGKEIKIPEYYPSIMTSNQVALYLNLAEKTIRKLTSEKKIPVTKIGGSARYRKEDLDLFLKNNTTHPNKTKNK